MFSVIFKRVPIGRSRFIIAAFLLLHYIYHNSDHIKYNQLTLSNWFWVRVPSDPWFRTIETMFYDHYIASKLQNYNTKIERRLNYLMIKINT